MLSRRCSAPVALLMMMAGCAPLWVATQKPKPIEVAVPAVEPVPALPVADAGLTSDEALSEAEVDAEDAAEVAEPGEDEEVGQLSEEPGEGLDEGPVDAGWVYTLDLNDEALQSTWKGNPDSLGSISLGFVEEGRLINGVPFPAGEGWTVVSPGTTYGTQETIDFVTSAIRQVKAWFPDAPPLRVNEISAREGGYLRPHKTHQNGRDVDLGFYYPGGQTLRVRERERVIDLEKTWALVKALVMHGDVQFILVDKRVQKVLFEYASTIGENPEWLDSLFHAGRASILQHVRRHRDHFHVRFFNARAQELGRRVAPLLAERPEQNLAMHRVRRGDTLGSIALRYGSSVRAILKASGMQNSFLRVGRVLKVPLRKPCTSCPVPPATIVPPRRLPPPTLEAGRQADVARRDG